MGQRALTGAFRIALMAKAPVAGQAKTRLAPALGPDGAAALAERLLRHALTQAAAARPVSITLWAAPDSTHAAFVSARRRHGALLRVQPPGDLGLRMARVFETAFAAVGDPVSDTEPSLCALPLLLTGTDAPALDAPMLQRAAAVLTTHDAVFVPALDGGYALVGLAHAAPGLLADLFTGMRWSHDRVMYDTRLRLCNGGWRHVELPPVADIDEPGDLIHVPDGWLHG